MKHIKMNIIDRQLTLDSVKLTLIKGLNKAEIKGDILEIKDDIEIRMLNFEQFFLINGRCSLLSILLIKDKDEISANILVSGSGEYEGVSWGCEEKLLDSAKKIFENANFILIES